MKVFTAFLLAAMLLVASTALAAQRNASETYTTTVFSQYTGMASTARYSTAIKTDAYTLKTLIFSGYSTNGTDTLATLPGTAILQCGPTSTGPWVTAKSQSDNAMSATTSTLFTMFDICPWTRVGWTKTGTGKRSLSAWLLFGPQN